MTTFQKGNKIYVLSETAITLYDGGQPDTPNQWNLPNPEGNVKDYYGDLRQSQQQLLFQPSSLIGTATGKTQLYNGRTYVQVLIESTVDKRTGHGLGAGTYEKINWLGWADPEQITNDYNLTIAGIEAANVASDRKYVNGVLQDGKNTPVTGNTNTSGSTKKISSTAWIIIGILLLLIGGVWKLIAGKKKRDKAKESEKQGNAQAVNIIRIPKNT
ncbi:MAG: hypothetical protein H7339_08805 [Arcicella sp.]|nr:hypothetical protein [Arcicella sp.]